MNPNESFKQLVCFKLSNEEYAIPIHIAQEIVKTVDTTPIPQVPDYVCGVVNIRGNVVPVFDLRTLFSLPKTNGDAKQSRILVINLDGVISSFLVDQILDNIKLSTSEIDPPPSINMSINRDCILGIGKFNKRMITIINYDTVHNVIMNGMASMH